MYISFFSVISNYSAILWSINERIILFLFASINLALYIFIEFFRPPINQLIDLPQNYAQLFQINNVIVCFKGAGLGKCCSIK